MPFLQFSPDSNRVAYVAQKGGKYFAVVDGVKGMEFDRIAWVVFSRDSRHAWYEGAKDNQWTFVEDGNRHPNSAVVGISSDGKRTAFVFGDNEKSYVVVDGKKRQQVEQILHQSFTFSANGLGFAYLAEQGNNRFAVVNGARGEDFDWVSEIKLSPDGKHSGYNARKGEKWLAVVDGVCSQPFDWAYDFTYSSDSKRVAYKAKEGKTMFAIVDGVRKEAFAEVSGITFSPDSKHIGYVAAVGDEPWHYEYFPVIDGVKKEPLGGQGHWIHFSPDGNRYLCEVWTGKGGFVVVDGAKQEGFLHLSNSTFSPDSKHVVYVGENGGKYTVVVDGQHGEWLMQCKNLTMSKDEKHVVFGTQKGRELWWKVLSLE